MNNVADRTVSPSKPRLRSTVKGTLIGVRLQPDLLKGLDAYVRAQGDFPTRPEGIRLALRDWLTERGFLQAPPLDHAAVSEKIAELDAHAASLKHDGKPSPANALKTMKRAVAKNEATKLRNRLAKAKGK